MIEFKAGRYFIGVWFACNRDGNKKDWMGTAYRDPGGPWTVRYRFRYYHSSESEASWVEAKHNSDATEEFAKEAMEMILSMMPMGGMPEMDFCPMYSDDPKENMRRLSQRPWARITQVNVKKKNEEA